MSVSHYIKSFPFNNIHQSLGMLDWEAMGDEGILWVAGLGLLPQVQCLLFCNRVYPYDTTDETAYLENCYS